MSTTGLVFCSFCMSRQSHFYILTSAEVLREKINTTVFKPSA